jgi:hypothetical protein
VGRRRDESFASHVSWNAEYGHRRIVGPYTYTFTLFPSQRSFWLGRGEDGSFDHSCNVSTINQQNVFSTIHPRSPFPVPSFPLCPFAPTTYSPPSPTSRVLTFTDGNVHNSLLFFFFFSTLLNAEGIFDALPAM